MENPVENFLKTACQTLHFRFPFLIKYFVHNPPNAPHYDKKFRRKYILQSHLFCYIMVL